ncbi:3-hydroxyacyl-CoA dehydrogenase NAD-binding domain-containing protein [Paraburkholderia sp. SARCC-3016]|uniref:3-hydroxyacyl-CoA dehydrogenase NAD-binding domain-containing protein n=1 Tax=Paraburkholderia sp. SARCC-3016 TaxID=3058611 RepID=UPI002809FABE|nr:3-hydroxyacyl-CoA dehydrogenase NAD-binding domain-containing protein [Paraburkholderia sp. SARCC-3016]MDQ7982471.1 3-hydroxyacyl-CoA dehydrogenase NAD-binding domain-containing protein [Paraburkholderia sp. SARCC-3016]
MAVDYATRDGVAVITLNNPPVNGLGHATRAGIVDALERARQDPAVTAVVLTGAGKVFCGGADITEFNTPKASAEPMLGTVIRALEGSAKPVVAALHGVAVGGGLELALGAHYRVAARGTQIALPEVTLGLLPGAGGTQRLPRAIGLQRALDMIVTGAPAMSEALADTALFDRLAEADLLDAALALARDAGARPGPHPQLRERAIDGPDAAAHLASARKRIAGTARHFPAPHRCIDAIEAGALHGFNQGLAFERECFVALVQSPESRALRHAFFGERAAGKIADVPSDTPTRTIAQVAVIGAGTMGGGIAMSFANAGLPVTLIDTGNEAIERGLATIRKNYDNTVKKGRLAAEAAQERLARIEPSLSYDNLKHADLIVEAVFEDLNVKEQVFRRIDALAKPGAILASNTSTLDLNRIAAFTQRPQDVIGMHFFSPANVMKLLEVVRGEQTAKDVLATVMKLAKKLGKTAVVARVCDGFIGNRMIEQYIRQSLFMIEEGALPAQVDRAIEAFGFAMGPFRMSDLAGNDIGWAIRKRRYREHPEQRYAKVADRLCQMGRFGQKTGGGWYDYEPGERTACPSQAVDDMIVAHAREAGVARRELGDDEIVERLVYALVNEGAKILDEGIAAKASDIDMVYLTGYGFPLWRGGPMWYADTVGLDEVERAIRRYAAAEPNGDAWEIAPGLVERAAQGRRFNG